MVDFMEDLQFPPPKLLQNRIRFYESLIVFTIEQKHFYSVNTAQNTTF